MLSRTVVVILAICEESMECRLFGAETGVGAHRELGEPRFSIWFTSKQCAQNCGEEPKWNADNAWVGQRKEREGLNEMALGSGNIGGVNPPYRRGQDDEKNTSRENYGKAPYPARRGKKAPKNGEH